jgi:thioredoxin 1
MEHFIHINEANFEEKVLKSDRPILLEFGAVWCGPCKRVEPELVNLSESLSGKLVIAKLDVDESVNITLKYNVMSVPTIVLFVDGEPCTRMSGFLPQERIMSKIEPFIS